MPEQPDDSRSEARDHQPQSHNEPNPFVAFRRFADDSVVAILNGMREPVGQLIKEVDARLEGEQQEAWRTFAAGYERATNPERRHTDTTRLSAAARQPAPLEASKLEGAHIPSPVKPTFMCPFTDHSSPSAVFGTSEYSPLALESEPRLSQRKDWRRAFEDLMLAEQGKPLQDKPGRRQESADAWILRLTDRGLIHPLAWEAPMFMPHLLSSLVFGSPHLAPSDRTGIEKRIDSELDMYEAFLGRDDRSASRQPPRDRWEKKCSAEGMPYWVDHKAQITTWLDPSSPSSENPSNTSSELGRSEETSARPLDKWERKHSADGSRYGVDHKARPNTWLHSSSEEQTNVQAASSTQSSTAAGLESKPSVFSTMTTVETVTNPDGSSTTRTVLKQRFADGRVESTDTTESRPAPSSASRSQAAPLVADARTQEQRPAAKKGWFWSG